MTDLDYPSLKDIKESLDKVGTWDIKKYSMHNMRCVLIAASRYYDERTAEPKKQESKIPLDTNLSQVLI